MEMPTVLVLNFVITCEKCNYTVGPSAQTESVALRLWNPIAAFLATPHR